jgi:hypothetical protein
VVVPHPLASSVLDQPFDAGALAALLRFDEAELIEELERLCEHRLLRVDLLRVDSLRFRFRYELVREVLIASLSLARQRLLRERVDRGSDDLSSTPTAQRKRQPERHWPPSV